MSKIINPTTELQNNPTTEDKDFTTTSIFSEIKEAAEKHKNQQLNFRFRAPEINDPTTLALAKNSGN